MTINAVEWQYPPEGLIATVLEEDVFLTPNLISLMGTFNDSFDPDLMFEVISGEFPETLYIDNTEKSIKGAIREMDLYVNDYEKPEDFSYDTETKSGGNYASFGSSLAYSKTFTFTIRVYKEDMRDSNGDLVPEGYDDRIFHIIVRNNYSSSRDAFIREYFSLEEQSSKGLLLDDSGNSLTPEQWIEFQKSKGYYT